MLFVFAARSGNLARKVVENYLEESEFSAIKMRRDPLPLFLFDKDYGFIAKMYLKSFIIMERLWQAY